MVWQKIFVCFGQMVYFWNVFEMVVSFRAEIIQIITNFTNIITNDCYHHQ